MSIKMFFEKGKEVFGKAKIYLHFVCTMFGIAVCFKYGVSTFVFIPVCFLSIIVIISLITEELGWILWWIKTGSLSMILMSFMFWNGLNPNNWNVVEKSKTAWVEKSFFIGTPFTFDVYHISKTETKILPIRAKSADGVAIGNAEVDIEVQKEGAARLFKSENATDPF